MCADQENKINYKSPNKHLALMRDYGMCLWVTQKIGKCCPEGK